MIANYSPFLEFLAALYSTIFLDNIITQKVWTPQYIDGLKKAIDGVDFAGNGFMGRTIMEVNIEKAKELQLRSTKKSIFMIIIITFLLIFCGYEQDFDNDVLSLHNALFYSLTIGGGIPLLVFFKVVFSKWKWTILTSLFNIFLFVFIYNYRLFYGCSKLEQYVTTYIGLYVSIILVLPILWQILLCWLYRGAFIGYIKAKIIEKKEIYDDTIKKVEEGNIDDIPEDYKNIVLKTATAHKEETIQNALDSSIDLYADKLIQMITDLCKNLSPWTILGSWIKYQKSVVFSKSERKDTKSNDKHTDSLISIDSVLGNDK